MTVRFDNSKYVASHGRGPRGRGSWAFEIRGLNQHDLDHWVLWGYGSLTDAKRQVRERLAELVGPENGTLEQLEAQYLIAYVMP